MNTLNLVYDSPKMEVVEMEVEQAILIESGIKSEGDWE
jgi:hypothetical protein